MSTEALNLDQAVERFMSPEESVEESEISEEIIEDVVEDTEEDDSEVDYSEEEEDDSESEDYDADEESAEDEDDEPDQVEPENITVKVDGEEISVTLEDLKRSYSGQGKIQKGMQEAAQIRKQAEEYRQQSVAMAQQIASMYEGVQQSGFKAPPQEPDYEAYRNDPIGYIEEKAQYEQDMKVFQQQQQQLAQSKAVMQQQELRAQQQLVAQEMQILREKIPAFGNAEKAAKLRDELMQTGMQSYGYTTEELGGVADHRALMVLHDAMQWRRSQSKRSQVEGKASNARPVIKPQAKKVSNPKRKQLQQKKQSLRKTGSIDDALGLIMNS